MTIDRQTTGRSTYPTTPRPHHLTTPRPHHPTTRQDQTHPYQLITQQGPLSDLSTIPILSIVDGYITSALTRTPRSTPRPTTLDPWTPCNLPPRKSSSHPPSNLPIETNRPRPRIADAHSLFDSSSKSNIVRKYAADAPYDFIYAARLDDSLQPDRGRQGRAPDLVPGYVPSTDLFINLMGAVDRVRAASRWSMALHRGPSGRAEFGLCDIVSRCHGRPWAPIGYWFTQLLARMLT